MTSSAPCTVAVLVGLQASGKSTFAASGRFDGWTRVSKDDWPHARHRQRRQLRLVDEAVAARIDVVVDNTNPSPAQWQPLIAAARAHEARVEAFWFPPDVAATLSRNAARPSSTRVPDVGLFTVLSQLQRPSPQDGFDAVWVVTWDGRGGFETTALTAEQV